MARSIAKRSAKILVKGLGCVVALVFGLVALVLLALAIPPLRAFAVQQGVAYANRTLDGYTVAIERVDRLDPWGVNARGLALFDPQHRQIVEVPWLLVRLEPFALSGTRSRSRAWRSTASARSCTRPIRKRPRRRRQRSPPSRRSSRFVRIGCGSGAPRS